MFSSHRFSSFHAVVSHNKQISPRQHACLQQLLPFLDTRSVWSYFSDRHFYFCMLEILHFETCCSQLLFPTIIPPSACSLCVHARSIKETKYWGRNFTWNWYQDCWRNCINCACVMVNWLHLPGSDNCRYRTRSLKEAIIISSHITRTHGSVYLWNLSW